MSFFLMSKEYFEQTVLYIYLLFFAECNAFSNKTKPESLKIKISDLTAIKVLQKSFDSDNGISTRKTLSEYNLIFLSIQYNEHSEETAKLFANFDDVRLLYHYTLSRSLF